MRCASSTITSAEPRTAVLPVCGLHGGPLAVARTGKRDCPLQGQVRRRIWADPPGPLRADAADGHYHQTGTSVPRTATGPRCATRPGRPAAWKFTRPRSTAWTRAWARSSRRCTKDKLLDNTLVLYLQDNGACAEAIGRSAKKTGRTPPMPGPADTWISYGQAWANTSNTPLRYYKHFVHEGGISTPLIAHWPAGIRPSR